MTTEPAFIDLLRTIATDPSARGLDDDAAVLTIDKQTLVLTKDMLVEGVHFLPDDPPADIAWKLVAVNASDLAAKGATPLACLTGHSLSRDADWDAAFVQGLKAALDHHGLLLIGGDTVSVPPGQARVLSLTAIGLPSVPVPPSRSGALVTDGLFVTGTIGDGWAGLTLLQTGKTEPATLIAAYRRPKARIADGAALAQVAHAVMDVSDGLLIDAARMARASGLAVRIDLAQVPLSPDFVATIGSDQAAAIAAATGGDDYQLLFAADAEAHLPVPARRIGGFTQGEGLTLSWNGMPIETPEKLGWLHG
ncbi:thiamine-phosphate kinase [Blastomonas natatoria]|uniref:Thiamine-monophosphate kinase n=1 Tax=Blastomonas natatoria TaxID=34015 RepID=A0A2V3UTP3_9SPHN|nr:thiamine-phosphate kinase [Blastomonas natatoria]PXW71267.1 thiamine-phosphate kinase [Blastomonas natatoria]